MDDYKRGISLQWSQALRNFMDEKDIKVVQIAELLGRSHGYVSQRTTGREALSLDIVQAVAYLAHLEPKALMVDLQERVGRMPPTPVPEPEASRPDTASLPSPDQAGDAN